MDKWLTKLMGAIVAGVAVYYLTEGIPKKTEPVVENNKPIVEEPKLDSIAKVPVSPSTITEESNSELTVEEPKLDSIAKAPVSPPTITEDSLPKVQLPFNGECEVVPGGIWLERPNVYYGSYYGHTIAWNGAGGFYTKHPATYDIFHPDSYNTGQAQRNVWYRISNTPFNICVDSSNRVFAQYSP